MPKIDWIIHMMGNGVYCAVCGKVENSFPEYTCNAHTHGMEKYGHLDFQMVIHTDPELMGYVLNELGLRVQSGQQFKAGDMVEDIFLDCPVRLDEFDECGRKVLRVIIPDGKNRFPEDPACDYPYSFQLIPTDKLVKTIGAFS